MSGRVIGRRDENKKKKKTMGSMIGSIESLLHLDKPDFIETWIRFFAALVQSKETMKNMEVKI